MQCTMFQFEFLEKAASHNDRMLQHHGCDLASTLQHQQHSPLTPGSEFKDMNILRQLCQGHPMWERLQQYLTDGVGYS